MLIFLGAAEISSFQTTISDDRLNIVMGGFDVYTTQPKRFFYVEDGKMCPALHHAKWKPYCEKSLTVGPDLFRYTGKDGTEKNIGYVTYLPPDSDPKGLLVEIYGGGGELSYKATGPDSRFRSFPHNQIAVMQLHLNDLQESEHPFWYVHQAMYQKEHLALLADSIKGVMDQLGKQLPILRDCKRYLIGHSFGGMLIGYVATHYPDLFEKYIIIAGCSYTLREEPKGPRLNPMHFGELSWAQDMAKIVKPVALIHGRHDQRVPIQETLQLLDYAQRNHPEIYPLFHFLPIDGDHYTDYPNAWIYHFITHADQYASNAVKAFRRFDTEWRTKDIKADAPYGIIIQHYPLARKTSYPTFEDWTWEDEVKSTLYSSLRLDSEYDFDQSNDTKYLSKQIWEKGVVVKKIRALHPGIIEHREAITNAFQNKVKQLEETEESLDSVSGESFDLVHELEWTLEEIRDARQEGNGGNERSIFDSLIARYKEDTAAAHKESLVDLFFKGIENEHFLSFYSPSAGEYLPLLWDVVFDPSYWIGKDEERTQIAGPLFRIGELVQPLLQEKRQLVRNMRRELIQQARLRAEGTQTP